MNKLLSFISILTTIAISSCKHEIPLPEGSHSREGCDPDTVYFAQDIKPLLNSNCGMPGCHENAREDNEWVALNSYEAIMASDIVKKGRGADSELYEALNETGEDRMPQPPNDPLSEADKEKIRKWIDQGALNNSCEGECDTGDVSYSNQVVTILKANCTKCHTSPTGEKGVFLDSYEEVKKNADNGRLLGSVRHKKPYTAMPYNSDPLNKCNIRTLSIWIEQGAPNN